MLGVGSGLRVGLGVEVGVGLGVELGVGFADPHPSSNLALALTLAVILTATLSKTCKSINVGFPHAPFTG